MMRKKYRLLLLALVFVGTLLSSFHYHDDAQTSEDCPVCILQHISVGADIPDNVVLQELALFFLIPLSGLQAYISTKLIRSYPSRAPPSFS